MSKAQSNLIVVVSIVILTVCAWFSYAPSNSESQLTQIYRPVYNGLIIDAHGLAVSNQSTCAIAYATITRASTLIKFVHVGCDDVYYTIERNMVVLYTIHG